MLYNTDLEELVFNQHLFHNADELIIISGYLGPSPVERISNLNLNTTIVYGMYPSDGIGQRLHDSLNIIKRRHPNVNILYSSFPVHSKCYIWKRGNQIVQALIGSANFSAKGLRTPFREILTIANPITYESLNNYVNMILGVATPCEQINLVARQMPLRNDNTDVVTLTNYCRMTLLVPNTGQIHDASGINWGQNIDNHTNPRDAAIPIRARHIREYPNLFPPKLEFPNNPDGGRIHRHNDAIDIIWDDGTTMEGLLEGSQEIDGVKYPKQISSFPSKYIMGDYLRQRIGVASRAFVHTLDLENYGRTHIDVSIIEDGVYYLDFSVPIENT